MFIREMIGNKLYITWELLGHKGVFAIEKTDGTLKRYNKRSPIKENFPELSDDYISAQVEIEAERMQCKKEFEKAGGREELERRIYNDTHFEK